MPIGGHFADLRPAAQAARPFPSIVPDAAEAAANCIAAAGIRLCLDLQQHSATALEFLHEVHQHPRLAEERFLAAAVRRYERCWLPLLAAHAEKCASAAAHADAQGHDSSRSAAGIPPPAAAEAAAAAAAAIKGNGMTAVSAAAAALATSGYSGQLAAPLDVAWVWWAHSIAPAAYRQDLEAVLSPGAAAVLWSSAAPGSVPHVRPAAALAATQVLWHAAFPGEPFHLPGLEPPCSDGSADAAGSSPGGAIAVHDGDFQDGRQTAKRSGGSGTHVGERTPAAAVAVAAAADAAPIPAGSRQPDQLRGPPDGAACSYEIIDAAVRQFDFYWSTCLPHDREARFVARAVQRYTKFLHLHRIAAGQFLVPAYDMDLVWHTHMACSAAYYSDCESLFGSVFAHDDSVNDRTPGSKLQTNWATSQELYWAKFGEPLAAPGAMWRGPPPHAWASGPVAEAAAAGAAVGAEAEGVDLATLQRPRVYALTDAATGGPPALCGTSWPTAAVPKDGWRVVVRATLADGSGAAGGGAPGDWLLLMQHWGPGSRAALVQVVTPESRVEARARLIGRESLPVADDTEPRPDASTPALRFSPPGSAGPPGLDTLERAFSITSPHGDWGVSIARLAPAADHRAAPLAVDLYRLDPRGGPTQALWHMRAQHTAGGARLCFGPVDGAASRSRSNGSGGASPEDADSPPQDCAADSSALSAAPVASAARAQTSGSAAATPANGTSSQMPSAAYPTANGQLPPPRAGRLRRALAAVLRLGGGSRKQAAADEAQCARAAAAACQAAGRMFADLDAGFRGVGIMLGGPAAQRTSPAAQPGHHAGQPIPSAAGNQPQYGRLQSDTQPSSHGLHNGQPLYGTAADNATDSSVMAPAADGTLRPDTAGVRPAAAAKTEAATQLALDAGTARQPETRHPAASGPPVAVAVAAGEGAAQALALAGALALQSLMLEGLNTSS